MTAADSIYLKTKRVLLRQYRDSDFDLMIDLDSDPEVMKYLGNGVPSTREEVAAGVERTVAYHEKFNGRLGAWTAELLESGDFIGCFHLRPGKLDPKNVKILELGCRLKKPFWAKGYATEVSLALLKKGFEALGAESIFAKSMKKNLSSRRVMEKIGMTFEREFVDTSYPSNSANELDVIYRLRRADWFK